MSEQILYWCLCRRYCKGIRKPLNTLNTWRRHLREANEDEKEAIRLAGRSEQFRAFVQATASTVPGPSQSEQQDASLHTSSRRGRLADDDIDEADRRPSRRLSPPFVPEVSSLSYTIDCLVLSPNVLPAEPRSTEYPNCGRCYPG